MRHRPGQPFSRQFHHPTLTPEQAFYEQNRRFGPKPEQKKALSGLFSAASDLRQNLFTWMAGPFAAKPAVPETKPLLPEKPQPKRESRTPVHS